MIAAAATFAGCINDAVREDIPGNEEVMGNIYIRFRMSLNADGTYAASRAGEEGATDPTSGETPGSDGENRINTVDLLVYNTADKLIDIIYLNETQTEQIGKPEGICIPICAQKGQTIRIYAMVNMPRAMRDRFTIGSGLDMSVVCPGNDYTKVMDVFIPDSGGKQETLEGNRAGGIPMTGQFKIGATGEEGTDIPVTDKHPTNDKALVVTANVSRIVSKIHVLAAPADANAPKYARALHNSAEPATASNTVGWIRMENVRYMPNGINRSSYILPQANDETNPQSSQLKDLNMSLDGYITGTAFNTQMRDNDYVFLKGENLHRANLDGIMARADVYSAERLAMTARGEEGRYVQGMYCPENYFDTPQNATMFETYDDVIPMITHVSIAVKLTPRVILIESDYKTVMQEFVDLFNANPETFRKTYNLSETDFTQRDANTWDGMKNKLDDLPTNHGCLEFRPDNEEEALFIINTSLKMRGKWTSNASDFEEGQYSDGTYYVYDQQYDGQDHVGPRYLFLTAGAVAESKGVYITIKARSVPHIGGWGYYYTYIDDNGTTLDGKTPYTASQVTRNKYYIITVSNFGVPGGTITEPEYIKVNTEPVNWDYSGSGNINLH